jgi:GT2 family glycosyltransferase/glycosyltransferase involved in cell wall biosynthesis/Flp pilus assembly protein TadD
MMNRQIENKIVIIQGGFPSVSATFILDQMTGLVDKGFEIENWATYNTGTSTIHKDIEKYKLLNKTKYISIPPEKLKRKPQEWLQNFVQVNNIESLNDVYAFHVHYGVNFNLLEPLFRLSDKYVLVSFHGYDASRYFLQKGDDCYKYLFERADLITTPSYFMKNELTKRGCNQDKIIIHRYGIDLEGFFCKNRIFNKNKITFLTVGRFVEKKGIEYSLKAFAKIHKAVNSEYRVVGEGELLDKYLEIVALEKINDCVKFLGPKTKAEVIEEMRNADIFVLTSVVAEDGDSEGVPVSLTEAHAMGLPVVSSYHAGISELVIHGETGLLSNEKNINSIAKNMLKIASDTGLRERFSKNATARVKDEFNIAKLNDKLFSILCDMKIQNDKINEFTNLLADKNWQYKRRLYLDKIRDFEIRKTSQPDISVIVISWRLHPDNLKNFQILEKQRDQNFELIFVDNGGKAGEFETLKPYIDTYVGLNTNTGAYLARNIGAVFARAPVLLFLEDDGIPSDRLLSAHLEQYSVYDIVCARGVYTPKTDNPLNKKATHYYLGPNPFPIYPDTEGNFSIKSELFFRTGGWDDEIRFGCGGVDLSRRIFEIEPELRKQIYTPLAEIFHDYASDNQHLNEKVEKQNNSRQYLRQKHPDYENFLKMWEPFWQRPDTLIETKTAGLNPISILIPTYNRANYIKEAILSAINQTYSPYEIIIVDDGSTDGTEEIISKINSDKIRYIKKEHSGAPETRNRAITETRSEFILWLDSDDILFPKALELYCATIKKGPDADIYYGNLLVTDEHMAAKRELKYADWYGRNELLITTLFIGNCVPNPGTLVRKSCYESYGMYDNTYTRAHDYEFWCRISRSARFKHIGSFVCKWRWHTSNMSSESVTIDFSYDARIARNMLVQFTIRELFPQLNWTDYKKSLAKAYLIIGNIFFKYKDYNATLEYYGKSLEAMPMDDGYYNMGIVYYQTQQFDRAQDAFQHALRLNPDNQKAKDILHHLSPLNSQKFDKKGIINPDSQGVPNLVVAPDQEESQVNISGNNVPLAYKLNIEHGEELFAKGDFVGAFEAFLSAVSLNPKDARAYNNLGVVYWKAGNNLDALKNFRKALALDPNDPDTILNSSELLISMGKYHQAIGILKTYLSRHPECSDVKDLLLRIKASDPDDNINVNHLSSQESDYGNAEVKDTSLLSSDIKSIKTSKNNFRLRIVAIIAAYNEGDVIYHVIGDLIENGVEVYLIDNSSTDNTVAEASKWLGKGLLHVERFPNDSGYPERDSQKYVWTDLLKRKEEVAAQLGADWYIHADADEFRESPWPDMSLAESIILVDSLGFNAIHFELLNFRPTTNDFIPGADVREYLTYYEPGETIDYPQIKAWKSFGQSFKLNGGGHIITFNDRSIFPIPFILRHYPLRSETHARQKIFAERVPRFAEEERAIGMHIQYNQLLESKHFLYKPSQLELYDPSAVRAKILSRMTKDLLLLNVLHNNDIFQSGLNGASLSEWLQRLQILDKPISSPQLIQMLGETDKILSHILVPGEKQDSLFSQLKPDEILLIQAQASIKRAYADLCGDVQLSRRLDDLIRKLQSYHTASGENSKSTGDPSKIRQHKDPTEIMVSIIIVTYNSLSDIDRCLSSIQSQTSSPYEVFIIDNNSTDGTKDYLRGLNGFHVTINDENVGFAKACNQGIKKAKGEYIVLLNPDTAVTNGWSCRMIQHFKDGIGAVGPVSNYVAGLQKYEIYKKTDLGNADNNEISHNFYVWNKNRSIETKLLVGFCMMIKRSVMDDVGMLDEDFFLGIEDLEYSWRLRQKGYRLVVATDVFIFHQGQKSFSTVLPEKNRRITQECQDKLYTKLEAYYGKGQVPSSQELWGMDWFRPSQITKSTLTSIIILCFNQIEYTIRCLQSIEKHTSVPYELILVDNGSSDGTKAFLERYAEKHTECNIILNKDNRGFAGGNNQAIAAAKGDYILLLNNDVVVTQDWLERLIAHVESDANIGMAGPVSNSISGPQQVEHVSYNGDLIRMRQFARDYSKKNVGRIQDILRLVGFCLLIKRHVLDIIGGLDENYGNGNYEDDDICLRSRIAGFRNIIAHDVFIHHYGSMTFRGNAIDYIATMQDNQKYFANKWKDIVEVNGDAYTVHITREDQLKKLIEWGEERFSHGNINAAAKIFERVLMFDKTNSRALNNIGVIQWQLGDVVSAIKTFQAALTFNPNDSDTVENLVQGAMETGRFDLINPAFLDSLKQAQRENPDFIKLIDTLQNSASAI